MTLMQGQHVAFIPPYMARGDAALWNGRCKGS
jgi:hypothetical protein